MADHPVATGPDSFTASGDFVLSGSSISEHRDTANQDSAFVDRRGVPDPSPRAPIPAHSERRQFGSSHQGLSEEGRELAIAIDGYKLQNHRRYITCDEMLTVIRSLGYDRSQ